MRRTFGLIALIGLLGVGLAAPLPALGQLPAPGPAPVASPLQNGSPTESKPGDFLARVCDRLHIKISSRQENRLEMLVESESQILNLLEEVAEFRSGGTGLDILPGDFDASITPARSKTNWDLIQVRLAWSEVLAPVLPKPALDGPEAHAAGGGAADDSRFIVRLRALLQLILAQPRLTKGIIREGVDEGTPFWFQEIRWGGFPEAPELSMLGLGFNLHAYSEFGRELAASGLCGEIETHGLHFSRSEVAQRNLFAINLRLLTNRGKPQRGLFDILDLVEEVLGKNGGHLQQLSFEFPKEGETNFVDQTRKDLMRFVLVRFTLDDPQKFPEIIDILRTQKLPGGRVRIDRRDARDLVQSLPGNRFEITLRLDFP